MYLWMNSLKSMRMNTEYSLILSNLETFFKLICYNKACDEILKSFLFAGKLRDPDVKHLSLNFNDFWAFCL